MRLNWRDGVGTALVAGAVAVTLAVTNGWNWPFLSGARAGVIGVAILTFASCPLAARITPTTRWSDPLLVLTTILGIGAVVLVVAGLFADSMTILVGLTAIVVVMWLLTTARHLAETTPAGRRVAVG